MAEKNKILVLGSLAYDHEMKYGGLFKDIIVPNNYNIAITAKTKNVYFGGCAGNISYNLRLLQQQPVIMTVTGKDFNEYKQWLTGCGVDINSVYQSEKFFTASAIICTDDEQNQMTIFNPGAMYEVDTTQTLKTMEYGSIAWAIISPEFPKRMMKFAQECKELGIPFVFDPGQVLPGLSNEELMWGIKNSNVFIVNDYESAMLNKRLGLTPELIAEMCPIYVETHGDKGSTIMGKEGVFYIRAVQPSKIVDPTGCGDAYRAGFLAGLVQGKNLERCGQAGALCATYSIENEGTQLHKYTLEEFSKRLEDNFGSRFEE